MLSPLNVLSCTTRASTPGDGWVDLGTRRVLSRAFHDGSPNWISPAAFESHRQNIDLVVAGGSLEWLGPQFRVLVELKSAVNAPWILMGIDHPHADLKLTPPELEVISKALVVVSGQLAYQALRRIGVASFSLPCPSLFASQWEHPSRQMHSVGLVVLKDATNHPHWKDVREVTRHIIDTLRKWFTLRVICNSVDLFFEFVEVLKGEVLYCPEINWSINLLSACDAVVTNRLPAAVFANSLLKPALLVTSAEQNSWTAELYPYVINSRPQEVLQNLHQLDTDSVPRGLLNWKRDIEQRYLAVLSGWLKNHGLYRV